MAEQSVKDIVTPDTTPKNAPALSKEEMGPLGGTIRVDPKKLAFFQQELKPAPYVGLQGQNSGQATQQGGAQTQDPQSKAPATEVRLRSDESMKKLEEEYNKLATSSSGTKVSIKDVRKINDAVRNLPIKIPGFDGLDKIFKPVEELGKVTESINRIGSLFKSKPKEGPKLELKKEEIAEMMIEPISRLIEHHEALKEEAKTPDAKVSEKDEKLSKQIDQMRDIMQKFREGKIGTEDILRMAKLTAELRVEDGYKTIGEEKDKVGVAPLLPEKILNQRLEQVAKADVTAKAEIEAARKIPDAIERHTKLVLIATRGL